MRRQRRGSRAGAADSCSALILESTRNLVENQVGSHVTDATKRTSEMNDEPQHVPGGASNRDGLAAVAIAILAACLIILVISQVV